MLALAAACLPTILAVANPSLALGYSSDPAAIESNEQVSREEIEAHLKLLDGPQEMDDAAKTKSRELCQQALQQLDAAKPIEAAIAGYEARTASADADTAEKKRVRDGLPDKAPPIEEPSLDTPIVDLDQQLTDAKRNRKTAEDDYKRLEGEPNRRTARIAEIPKLIQSAQEQLAQVEQELAAKPSEGEAAQLTLARRYLNLAKQRSLQLTVRSLEKERTCYEETDELIQIQRDIAAKTLAIAQDHAQQWQSLVNKRREREARKEVVKKQNKRPPPNKQDGRRTTAIYPRQFRRRFNNWEKRTRSWQKSGPNWRSGSRKRPPRFRQFATS